MERLFTLLSVTHNGISKIKLSNTKATDFSVAVSLPSHSLVITIAFLI